MHDPTDADASGGAAGGAQRALRRNLEAVQDQLNASPLALLDLLPVYAWVAAPGGRCVYANRALLDFWGKDLAGAVGLGWTAAMHPDDLAASTGAWRDASARRGEVVDEMRMRRHDGAFRWLSVVGRPWYAPTGEYVGYLGAALDMTAPKAALVEANRALVAEVAARRRAEEELAASERRFRRLAENAKDILFRVRVRPQLQMEYVSPAAEAVSGYPLDAFSDVGFYLSRVLPEDRPALVGLYSTPWDSGPKRVVLRWLHADGHVVWMEQIAVPVYDATGTLEAVEGIARDVSGRERQEARLHHLATHDRLTGLANRTWYEDALDRLRRGGDFPVTVAVADLDGLKHVNDRLGHAAGDDLIRRAAAVLAAAVRAGDTVARIGGDEFALLMPGADEAAAAALRARVAAALAAGGGPGGPQPAGPALGLSLGTAVASGPESLADAVAAADSAMYADKQGRSVRVRVPGDADPDAPQRAAVPSV